MKDASFELDGGEFADKRLPFDPGNFTHQKRVEFSHEKGIQRSHFLKELLHIGLSTISPVGARMIIYFIRFIYDILYSKYTLNVIYALYV